MESIAWRAARYGRGVPGGIDTSNPFEIKFHVDETIKDSVSSRVGAVDDGTGASFEDEIDLFHAEMVGVFGSEPEEHAGDGSSPNSSSNSSCSSKSNRLSATPVETVTTDSSAHQGKWPLQSQWESPANPFNLQEQAPRQTKTCAPPEKQARARFDFDSSIMLIHGPCTFVHHSWVGSREQCSPEDIEQIAAQFATIHGLAIKQHHSNHEGEILDRILATAPGDKIILNWNGRLADSPLIFRALSSIRASVVILTPIDVELGPLPQSVKGVIAGFGTQSLELAIQACK